MTGPEHGFYEWLKRQHPDWDFIRIETSTESGTPDTHICAAPAEFWAELKALPTTNVQLRNHQWAWFNKHGKDRNLWVFNRDRSKGIFQAWRYPFTVADGKKDHVKIVSTPTIQLVEALVKGLKGKEFTN